MRSRTRRAALVLAVAGAVVALLRRPHARRTARRGVDRARRWLHRTSGRLRGTRYRMCGRRPAADVADPVLADRVRSTLGPLEKRLDLPHVHVMVEGGMVMLHGEVASQSDADQIERAVACVSGVRGVESFLHVGLIAGDARPSEGRLGRVPSAAPSRAG